MVPDRLPGHARIGWRRTSSAATSVPFLREKLDLGLSVEDAVEIFYNAAITPWLNMALDLQVVDSALNKTLSSSNQLVSMGTAVVGGLRTYLRSSRGPAHCRGTARRSRPDDAPSCGGRRRR